MKFITIIYVYTIRKIFSLFLNIWYLIPMLIPSIRNTIKEQKKLINNIKVKEDIDRFIEKFTYESDPIYGLLDWTPSINAFLIRGYTGDCDDAGVFVKYLFNHIGYKARNYIIVSKRPFLACSHVITIVEYNNKYLLYSNGTFLGSHKTKQIALDFYRETSPISYYDFEVEV